MNMFQPRRLALVTLLLALLAIDLRAQRPPAADRPRDMIDRIFSAEFRGRPRPPVRWADGGASYIALEPAAGGGTDIVKYDTVTGGNRQVLVTAAQLTPKGTNAPLGIDNLSWSRDGSRVLIFTNAQRVWRTDTRGDFYVLDRKSGQLSKLGGDAPAASLMYAKFSPDGTKVAYVRQNDLYVESLTNRRIRRLTSDGSETIVNGGSDWVNEEELAISDAFRWSPDGRSIAFWQFDTRGVRNFPLIYNLGKQREIVTTLPEKETGPYPVLMNVPYPLAGTTNSAVRAGIVDAAGGGARWIRLPGDPREHYIARLEWADAATVVVQQLNRLQNTQIVFLADRSGTVRPMWRDRDEAFFSIGFGGLPEAVPLRSGTEFLVLSEKDGWQHAYRVTRDGSETLVTRGSFDVDSIAGVDEPTGWLYFIASPDNATQRYLYRTRLDGNGDPVRVTPADQAGTHTYDISPDGKYAFHSRSSFDDPGSRDLVSLPDHRMLRVIDDRRELKEKVADLVKPAVEYFKVDAGDGVQVDGWMIKPKDFDPARRYPVLVHIYGEPASQTVADSWKGAGGLYHRYVASLGYLVVSFDNSGTPALRGRAWRKAVYGAVGVLSSRQQAQALRSLGARHRFVDLDRVAVWGWSGGGTNTLNLLFRHPDLYKVGMAVAPVPDQRLYDTIYQERYMGLPQTNAAGYKAGAAINFAEGLKGDLLIVHGSGDDNVHIQGTELLVNRLIELGKPFDYMVYPDRSHGINEGPGTTTHVYHLLTRYLTTHLVPGPR